MPDNIEYISTKTYTHSVGLSAAFRQWRAKHSHCQYIHGYALQIRIEFAADTLDERNWVVDFGGLKDIKSWLEWMFDHKLLIATDDPDLDFLTDLGNRNLAQIRIVPNVGCEAFAHMIFSHVNTWLTTKNLAPRVYVNLVEVSEHGGNSAVVRWRW